MVSDEELSLIGPELKRRIDAASEIEEEPRWHLGASEIGDECLRRVWYKYRWIDREKFSGRMQRLFKRGHEEEAKIVALLASIGIEAVQFDPATGKQFRGSCVLGHYGGSGDGKADLPPDLYGLKCQLECKTHNAKSFNDLIKNGVKKSKPKHYTQMCVYGSLFDLDYGLYFASCKDNDDIHIEVIRLDRDVAENAKRKAEAVIFKDYPPPKINEKATYYVCRMCPFNAVCHSGTPAAVNCRSCRYAKPVDGGTWRCARWGIDIPRDKAPLGCQTWESVL